MISQKLAELQLQLPPAPAPLGSYVPWVRTGNLLFVSGMLPLENGQVAVKGKLGESVPAQEGKRAAMLCALNALSAALSAVGGDESRLRKVVMLNGYVNAVSGFTESPLILNGASDLLGALLGEKGQHARAAVAVAGLPKDAAVEVQIVFEVE